MAALDQQKTNALLNLISHLEDNDKIYMYAKDTHEPKYQLLIKTRKDAWVKHDHDPKAFIEHYG